MTLKIFAAQLEVANCDLKFGCPSFDIAICDVKTECVAARREETGTAMQPRLDSERGSVTRSGFASQRRLQLTVTF